MVTFAHHNAKGDRKTPENLLLQGGFSQGGAYGSEFFVSLQSLLSTLKTLCYESK